MTNASLQDLKRLCDALVSNPQSFSMELEKMGFNITLLEQRCSEITQDLLSRPDLSSPDVNATTVTYDDEYWPMDIRIIMTLIFSILSIIGIFGNILVVLVVFKVPGMRTPTNCYLVSLAVSDCLFFLATSPTEISYLHVASTTYIFGSLGCAVFTYVPYLAINTSSLSITAFTIERFIGICYPLRARYICTVKRAKIIILGIWVFSFFYNSPWLYLANLTPLKNGEICTFKLERDNWAYKLLYFTDLGMFYCVPMILNILIYGKITYTLSHNSMKSEKSSMQKSIIRNDSKKDGSPLETQVSLASPNMTAPREYFINGGKRSSTKGKMQVIKMLLIVVVIFAVCWIPYRAMVTYNSFAETKLNNDMYIFIAKTLIFINCAINPVLYNVMSARFRNAFKKLLRDKKSSPIFVPKESKQHSIMREYRNGDTRILVLSEDDGVVSNVS
uniref:Thyrotropin-releasing hormone receptor n=1 Tax=Panagrolaimus sp. PS1159 TaxID=55785 RepID=A0AC35GI21_9BILA